MSLNSTLYFEKDGKSKTTKYHTFSRVIDDLTPNEIDQLIKIISRLYPELDPKGAHFTFMLEGENGAISAWLHQGIYENMD